ncbi:MAG TPA: hypothetical protein VGQ09_21935 [Chitinophagaceae bacterium]|jgi:hypothetical protein|nr:hypothetical protein [Chitinophagaceae bacterium]
MKTKITAIAIVIMAFIAIAATPIQSSTPLKSSQKTSDGFSFIRTHRQGKGAAISWAFTSANASSFTVQRTYEDPTDPYAFWEDVSSTACNSSRSYKCDDANVYPGYISYRVIALLNDGSTIASEVSTIRIVSRH